jgi:uncharacterized protein involved in exopolysaccharide biosynthesis
MEKEIDILDYYNVIKKWKEFILSFTLAAVILTVAFCILVPWTYRAETVLLIPQQSGKGIEGIMALSSMMAGSSISIPTDINQSLLGRTTNFTDILRSKTLATMIIDQLKLKDVYGVKNKESLISKVQKKLKVKEQKGILKIYAEDSNPRLAADIANYSVIALDEFNKKGNVQFARRIKIFTGEQLANAKVDLQLAEEKLKKFENQAQLVKVSERELMLARLMRDVKVQEAIYTMLLQEFEKSKIEEAKEDLFFEVLDPATTPKSPYRPKPLLYVFLSIFIGAFASTFIAFFFEYLEKLGVKIPKIDYRKEVKWPNRMKR